jgi:hypothetical protein
MSDHERIWLQNANDAKQHSEGRLWCEDKVWPDDPEDGEPTEYVRADIAAATIERLTRERDEFRGKLAETCGKWQASEIRAEAELAKAQQERDEERDAAGKASWDILTLHSRIASLSTELARAALPPAKTEGE